MHIVDNPPKKDKVYIKDLKAGDVFEDGNGTLCLKTDGDNARPNAIALRTGYFQTYGQYAPVTRVDGSFVRKYPDQE